METSVRRQKLCGDVRNAGLEGNVEHVPAICPVDEWKLAP
jgi:hypothetical protein